MGIIKSSNKGMLSSDKMPKARTLKRKDDPNRVKFYAKGRKVKK